MNLSRILKEDLIACLDWREGALSSLRTSDFLLDSQQEDFYEQNGNKWEPIAYGDMTDDEAKTAIRSCIRSRLRTGVDIADIHTALKEDVGVTGVALDIHPKPVDGRLPEIGRNRFEFQFMAHGPSGATI